MENGVPNENFQMPSVDQILEIIESMDMSAEEKADLKKSIMEGPDNGFQQVIRDQVVDHVANSGSDYLIFVMMIVIIGTIFGKNLNFFIHS